MTLVAAAVPASAGAVKETVEACGGPTILSLVGLEDDRDRGVADEDDRSGEGSMSDLAWRSERRARDDAPVAAASGQSCSSGGNPATRERRRDAEQVRRGEAPPSSSSVTSSAVPRAPARGVRRSGDVHLDKRGMSESSRRRPPAQNPATKCQRERSHERLPAQAPALCGRRCEPRAPARSTRDRGREPSCELREACARSHALGETWRAGAATAGLLRRGGAETAGCHMFKCS